MRAALYTLVFIVGFVLTGKKDMADAADFYHFVRTMHCANKVKGR